VDGTAGLECRAGRRSRRAPSAADSFDEDMSAASPTCPGVGQKGLGLKAPGCGDGRKSHWSPGCREERQKHSVCARDFAPLVTFDPFRRFPEVAA